MHSSTFSSDSHWASAKCWLKTWLVGLLLALACLAGWEVALRRLGYRPTVLDDLALWAVERDRVYGDCCEKPVVLLGDCRIRLGFVPQVLADRLSGHQVVQLAVERTSPVAVLRDLAEDEDFTGVVICALNTRQLCRDMWDTQQPYVDYYRHEYGLNRKLNRIAATAVQRRLAIANPQLRFHRQIGRLIWKGRLPKPVFIETRADRSRLADYSRADVEANRRYALNLARSLCTDYAVPDPAQWLEGAMEVEQWVRAIQDRGGQVVFVQYPATGELLHYDEQVFPRAQYWDAFAAQTSAVCIHFQDEPSLSGFACPDDSHIDRADAPRFTQGLTRVLEERGLFRGPCWTIARKDSAHDGASCSCCEHHRQRAASMACSCCSLQGHS